jgi:hypothetical protein
MLATGVDHQRTCNLPHGRTPARLWWSAIAWRRRVAYRSAFIACSASLALCGGCSASRPAATPAHSHTGTVTGILHLAGGPAPGTRTNVSGRIYAFASASLIGKPIATGTADPSGGFTLTLPAGTFYLAGTSPSFALDPPPATPPCHGEKSAVVSQGSTSRVDVICSMK